jgi:hypothetical protein
MPSSRKALVSELRDNMVISNPDTEQEPAVIQQIHQPVPGIRSMILVDIETSEELQPTFWLSDDRTVLVHDTDGYQQWYFNRTETSIDVKRGPGPALTIESGASYRFRGNPDPERFPTPDWEHRQTPLLAD